VVLRGRLGGVPRRHLGVRALSDARPGAVVEVCVSEAMDDLSTAPSWGTCRPWTSTLGQRSFQLNNSGNEYFYVRVRALGSDYDGTYAVAAFDGGGYCPLGVSGTRAPLRIVVVVADTC